MWETIVRYRERLGAHLARFLQKRYKHYQIMYHLTSRKSAFSILKNNFDVKRSKQRAFGRGINLAIHKRHLHRYASKSQSNYLIVSLVRYQKLKYNPPYPFKKTDDFMTYYNKHGYSRPTYMHTPKGYQGMYWGDICVMASARDVFPLYVAKVRF
jgi:hypothetical protein